MSYLFAAYAVVWVILCAYVFRLAQQNRSLRRDMIRLRERLDAQGKEG
ncbi:MAG: CcmD family protein [Nitrospinota bacterium]